MNKAAIYIRVGNAAQLSGDRQRQELVTKFGDTHEIVAEYQDEASSNLGVEDRPALKKLLEDAAKGEFDVLLCTDLPRLDRLLSLEIVTALRDAGVKVVTAARGEFGFGELIVHAIIDQSAGTESQRRSERIKLGVRAARQRREAAADAGGAGSGSE